MYAGTKAYFVCICAHLSTLLKVKWIVGESTWNGMLGCVLQGEKSLLMAYCKMRTGLTDSS